MKKIFKKIVCVILSVVVLLPLLLLLGVSTYAEEDINNRENIPEGLSSVDILAECEYEKSFEVLEYFNQYRAECGFKPLQMDRTMLEKAMCRASDVLVYYSHNSPNTHYKFENGVGYKKRDGVWFIADSNEEILGPGNDDTTAKDLAEGFKNSAPHYSILMREKSCFAGVAVIKSGGIERVIGLFTSSGLGDTTEYNVVSKSDYPTSVDRVFTVEVSPDCTTYSLGIDIIDTEFPEPQWTYGHWYSSNEPDQNSDRLCLRVIDNSGTSTAIVDPEQVTYRSGDTKKVKVDADGTFHVLVNENTTAKVIATYQGVDYERELQIYKSDEPEDDSGEDDGRQYWTSEIIEKPDCTTYGTKRFTDIKTGEYYDELVKPLGHKYNYVEVTPATMTKNGSIRTYCSRCDDEDEDKKTIIYAANDVSIDKSSFVYNGSVQKPNIIVKDANGKTISSKSYTVTYSNSSSKSVSKYKATINFIGAKYSGKKTFCYTIKPNSTSVSKLTKGKGNFTVTLKKQTTQTSGYQIQYSTSSKFTKSKTVFISNKTLKKTISKLSRKKKYYVRVRTYKTVTIDGKKTNIYSGWSKSKYITTK